MGSVTWRWRLLVPVVFCLRHAFLSFLGGREPWAELHLAHCNAVVTAVAVTPLGKRQGANRTVGHLASYLALFPFSLSTSLGSFSFLSDRVCWGGKGGGCCWASLSPPCFILLGTWASLLSNTSPHCASLLDSLPVPATLCSGSVVVVGVGDGGRGMFSGRVISKLLRFCSYLTD